MGALEELGCGEQNVGKHAASAERQRRGPGDGWPWAAVDDEQGTGDQEAFDDALTRLLQQFDPKANGTNASLYDTATSRPKYVSVVAAGDAGEAS